MQPATASGNITVPTVGGQQRIRVMCVDDHRLVREGIGLIIGRQQDMQVVAYAASESEAVTQFRVHQPDVTLMDLRLGEGSGIRAIEAIRQGAPRARFIVLTMYSGAEDIHRAMKAGAATYVLKDALSEDLIRVVREVHAGRTPIDPELEARLESRQGSTLTRREMQVIELVAEGFRNREIGTNLGITEQTAQVHVKNILAKLKVRDRTAAINVALKRGIIHIN
ncbi:MAG: response regulator transcription factor [Vicinamibacterales bacterium]